jgi:hypothetical protein
MRRISARIVINDHDSGLLDKALFLAINGTMVPAEGKWSLG